jgi:hypothetical protein
VNTPGTPAHRATGAPPSYPGSPTQTTYDAWIDHGRKCSGCKTAGTAKATKCRTGKDTWQSYTDAREAAGEGAPGTIPQHRDAGPVLAVSQPAHGAPR